MPVRRGETPAGGRAEAFLSKARARERARQDAVYREAQDDEERKSRRVLVALAVLSVLAYCMLAKQRAAQKDATPAAVVEVEVASADKV